MKSTICMHLLSYFVLCKAIIFYDNYYSGPTKHPTTTKMVESGHCSVVMADKNWTSQWYLNRTTNKYDMNVLPAWQRCVNGSGVTVGVVDNGIQDHIDLNINRTIGIAHWNTSSERSLKHGTRIAGIIAAKKDSMFTVGIAFGAHIADLKIANSSTFESFNASSLTHNIDIIDVYSCSFSSFMTGLRIFPLLKSYENVLKEGTSLGRNRKGSVYVFSTGNFGNDNDILKDSCAYDGLISNPYVIGVAGIQHDLTKVPDGESCASIMVAAFTAKPGEQMYNVVTLDVHNSTTTYMNDNSAAVPMVSGAVALSLSANPNLTYRDVMHLIVNTSRSNFPEFKNGAIFFTNAANHRVSSLFGFGLLDIGALVERSFEWKNVPKKYENTTTMYRTAPGCIGWKCVYNIPFPHSVISYIEHVEISVEISTTHARNIRFNLISPYGTKSTVVPGRRFDPDKSLNITVTSVQMWGENPTGMWKLVPSNPYQSILGDRVVHKVQLTIHGFDCEGFGHLKCFKPAK